MSFKSFFENASSDAKAAISELLNSHEQYLQESEALVHQAGLLVDKYKAVLGSTFSSLKGK